MQQIILNSNSKKQIIKKQIQLCNQLNQLKITTDLETKYNSILVSGISNLIDLEVIEILISSNSEYKQFYQSQDIYCILNSARALKSIFHLNISINTFHFLDQEGVNELSKLIKSLKKLEQLKLQFKFQDQLNDEVSLSKIIIALQKQSNLNLFELSIHGESYLSKDLIQQFKIALMNFSNLTHFKLDLKNVQIDNCGFIELGKGLVPLTQMISLSLSFSECNLYDNNFGFLKFLANYQQLEYLFLDFNKLLPTKKIQNILIQSLQSSFKLKEFYLKFIQNENSEMNPLKIIQSLQYNKNLQICEVTSPIKVLQDQEVIYEEQFELSVLQLNLTFIEFDETIRFGKFLQQFTNLSTLELCFDTIYGDLGDVAKQLKKALNKLIQLVVLKIIFKTGGQVGYGGAIQLGQGIAKLHNLESLNLQFESNNKIGQIGAQSIGLAFQNLKKLIDLTFKIGDNNYIDQLGVIGLKKGFQQLKSLQTLTFFIGQGNGIGSYQVKKIGQALNNMSQLQNLTLDIQSQSYQKQDMYGLVDAFQNFKNLKFLSIILNGQIKTQSIINFSKGISYLSNLYFLEIKLNLLHIEIVGFQILAQSIASIDSLRILNLKLEKFSEIYFDSFIKYFKKSKLTYVYLLFNTMTEHQNQRVNIKLQRILKSLVEFKLQYSSTFYENSDEDDSEHDSDSDY